MEPEQLVTLHGGCCSGRMSKPLPANNNGGAFWRGFGVAWVPQKGTEVRFTRSNCVHKLAAVQQKPDKRVCV